MAGISKAERERRAAMASEEQADEAKESATVAMWRDPDMYPAPHECDVHPDEVENYRAGGWNAK